MKNFIKNCALILFGIAFVFSTHFAHARFAGMARALNGASTSARSAAMGPRVGKGVDINAPVLTHHNRNVEPLLNNRYLNYLGASTGSLGLAGTFWEHRVIPKATRSTEFENAIKNLGYSFSEIEQMREEQNFPEDVLDMLIASSIVAYRDYPGEGNDGAFEYVVKKLSPWLRRLGEAKLNNYGGIPEDAGMVVNNTLERFRKSSYDPMIGPLKPYMARILKNEAIRISARNYLQNSNIDIDLLGDLREHDGEEAYRDIKECVDEIISRLANGKRRRVARWVIQGQSLVDIAYLGSMSRTTAHKYRDEFREQVAICFGYRL